MIKPVYVKDTGTWTLGNRKKKKWHDNLRPKAGYMLDKKQNIEIHKKCNISNLVEINTYRKGRPWRYTGKRHMAEGSVEL
jgi:hypothetical protein